jgi:phage terminase small subunit
LPFVGRFSISQEKPMTINDVAKKVAALESELGSITITRRLQIADTIRDGQGKGSNVTRYVRDLARALGKSSSYIDKALSDLLWTYLRDTPAGFERFGLVGKGREKRAKKKVEAAVDAYMATRQKLIELAEELGAQEQWEEAVAAE